MRISGLAGGLTSRLPSPAGLFSKLASPFSKLAPLFSKLKPLFSKLSTLLGPVGTKLGALLGPLRAKLAPLADKVEEEFHHVTDHLTAHAEGQDGDHVEMPPAFEFEAEHVPEKRRTALFAGLGVLGLGFLIGLGVWLMKSPAKETAQSSDNTPSISLPMPPRAGPGASLLSPSPPPGQEGVPAGQPQPSVPQSAEPPGSAPSPPTGETPPPQPSAQTAGAPAPPPESPSAGTPALPGMPAPASAPPARPDFTPPSLKDSQGAKLTSLSPVTGEPKLPANSGQMSVPKYAELPAIAPPAQPVLMPEAPQSALLKKTDAGSIPVVAPDGRESWKAYARPFDLADKRPRIAIVVFDLGLIKEAGEAGIARMPPEVALSFSPYSLKLDDWVKRSRAAGHEVFLDLPMDSRSFPMRDPGPLGLISSLSTSENQRRLESLLAKTQGYSGLVAVDGQRYLGASQQVDTMFRVVKQSGLMFIDNGMSGDPTATRLAEALDLAYAKANIMIDDRHFRAAIDIRLRKAEDDAQAKGRALVLIPSRPLAMDRVATWAKDLSARGIALAPVSALIPSKAPTP
ncbi:putative Skin secretory protein xP2 [Rhodospirillaceae bacterium LM-1]|nr:putative Skin secretory protein xP2 [Rhodospirillaceae bacterium LM-1]